MNFLNECPDCGETNLSWVDKRFGHCHRRPVKFKIRDRSGYHPGIARFPNDPEAYVGGDDSLRRVVDKRLAQGWERRERVELHDPAPRKPVDVGELYRMAKEGGAFDPNRPFGSLGVDKGED